VSKRLAAIAASAIALVLLGTAIGAVLVVMGPLPSRRGRVVLPHLSAPVDVRFDRRGIPHVRSVLEVDAWRALGFVHASDRLFQMELRRRAAAGRLSELFGAAAVPMDREARVNGYAARARRDWETVSEKERAALTAYAEGVNAFLADHALPLEWKALPAAPEPWTPIDSLAFGRLMQDGLSLADQSERSAFDDARARGLEAAVALNDAAESGATAVAPEVAAFLAALPRSDRAAKYPEESAPAGSNAWALTGTRTASGRPLLAGDPHLAAERPGVWYAAHVTSADGLDAIGLTLPGLPGILIGHNGRVAWSLTMHQADDCDSFLEQVDWNAGTYRRGDAWLPLTRSKETIHVKGGPDVEVDLAVTMHGPLVEVGDAGAGWAIARAFAPAELPQGLRAFLDAARAQDGAELLQAWSHYSGPSVNVCWAEVQGAVGLKVAGAIPRRGAGDGRFPAPGWIPDYDWKGMLPAESLPAIAEPKEGLVATANDDWSGAGVTLPYPGVFSEGDRAGRARQLGSALGRATVADMRTMQNDVYSPYAARVVAALRELRFADPRAAKAAGILTRWDGRALAHGPARLFFAFMKEARKGAGTPTMRITWAMLDRMIEGKAAQSFWDDPATPRTERRGERLEAALVAALDTVEKEDGPDPNQWSWGRTHRIVYRHAFAAALPAAVSRWITYGPVALPGEWHTLDVAGFPLRGDRYDVREIPSARLIVDLAQPDASRLVLPLGQSGQLFDRHGHDQLAAWSSGRDFALPFTAKAVEDATISTMRFVPGD